MKYQVDCSIFGPRLVGSTRKFCRTLPVFRHCSRFGISPSDLQLTEEDSISDEFFPLGELTCGVFLRTELVQNRQLSQAEIQLFLKEQLKQTILHIAFRMLDEKDTEIELLGPKENCKVTSEYFQRICPKSKILILEKQIKRQENFQFEILQIHDTCTEILQDPLQNLPENIIGLDVGSSSIKWCGKLNRDTVYGYQPIQNWEAEIEELFDQFKQHSVTLQITGVTRELLNGDTYINEITAQRDCAKQCFEDPPEKILDLGGHDFKVLSVTDATESRVNSSCLSGFGIFLSELCELLQIDWFTFDEYLKPTECIRYWKSHAVCSEQALQDFLKLSFISTKRVVVFSAVLWICSKLPKQLHECSRGLITGKLASLPNFKAFLSTYFSWDIRYAYTKPELSGAAGAAQSFGLIKKSQKTLKVFIKDLPEILEIQSSFGPCAIPFDLDPILLTEYLPREQSIASFKTQHVYCEPIARLRETLSEYRKQFKKKVRYIGYLNSEKPELFKSCPFTESESALATVLGVDECKLLHIKSFMKNPCLHTPIRCNPEKNIKLKNIFLGEPSCRFSVLYEKSTSELYIDRPFTGIGSAVLEDLLRDS